VSSETFRRRRAPSPRATAVVGAATCSTIAASLSSTKRVGWDETAEIERTVFLQVPAELERLDDYIAVGVQHVILGAAARSTSDAARLLAAAETSDYITLSRWTQPGGRGREALHRG
jgi:hypothetical protein